MCWSICGPGCCAWRKFYNDNGLRLLGICTEHKLLITNTILQLPTRHKTTWMHPRSKHLHILDYSIIRQKDRRDVLITCSAPSADESWMDHRLFLSKLNIQTCRCPLKFDDTEIRHTKPAASKTTGGELQGGRITTIHGQSKYEMVLIRNHRDFGPVRNFTSILKAADNIADSPRPKTF